MVLVSLLVSSLLLVVVMVFYVLCLVFVVFVGVIDFNGLLNLGCLSFKVFSSSMLYNFWWFKFIEIVDILEKGSGYCLLLGMKRGKDELRYSLNDGW